MKKSTLENIGYFFVAYLVVQAFISCFVGGLYWLVSQFGFVVAIILAIQIFPDPENTYICTNCDRKAYIGECCPHPNYIKKTF